MEMRLAPQARRQQQRRRRYTIIGVIILIVILILSYFSVVNRPMSQARSQLTTAAKKADKIQYVDSFHQISRQDTYYSITGRDKDKKSVGVLNKKGSSKLTTVNLDDGLTAADVKNTVEKNYDVKRITGPGLAEYQNIPVWDVTFIDKQDTLNFISYRVNDGKVLRSVQNF